MSLTIFATVALAALLHAIWNFLSKTITGGPIFVWLVATACTALYAPAVVWWLWNYGFEGSSMAAFGFLLTGVLHLVYFLTLQKGYEVADLSVVYPLARGSGPVFSALAAVLFLQEKMNGEAIAGLVLVVGGVFLISGIGQKSKDAARLRRGVLFGIGTGTLIASYTVWDAYLVKSLGYAPLLVDFACHPFRVVALGPKVCKDWQATRALWSANWQKILVISLLSPLGFILVLYAMQSAPISAVAPAREMSIVFGVVLGAKLLTEENFWPRLTGSLLILVGIFWVSGLRFSI